MNQKTRIGLIGDQDDSVPAHRAIPIALDRAAAALCLEIDVAWLPTAEISRDEKLAEWDALWCVPASPYRNAEGALRAIRLAREQKIPFLGTCGGFQHALLEYARNVLGWERVAHAEEIDPTNAADLQWVIAPLACSLKEAEDRVRFLPGSRLAVAYQSEVAKVKYNCRYGLNDAYAKELLGRALRATAWDPQDEVRGVELDDHPFFVATLFQPERDALSGLVPQIAVALLRAARDNARQKALAGDNRAVRVQTPQGEYWISADRQSVDSIAVHDYLRRSYWSEGISLDIVCRAIEHSICVGIYAAAGRQIGFGRVITDAATFAYLCDVYVLEEHRGRGLSHHLMQFIQSMPELRGLRRFVLATRDAHSLYERYGFTSLEAPDRYMEILDSEVYKRSLS